MSESEDNISIRDVSPNEREELEPILDDSFEGWYLRHSKRTLAQVEIVKEARVGEERAGLVMLKDLGTRLGYVYYIAVAKRFRGKGIAGKLLDSALNYFFNQGMAEVYASVEEDNEPSHRLFLSREFRETTRGEIAKKYGTFKSFDLMRKMVIVPGEIVLFKEISPKLAGEGRESS